MDREFVILLRTATFPRTERLWYSVDRWGCQRYVRRVGGSVDQHSPPAHRITAMSPTNVLSSVGFTHSRIFPMISCTDHIRYLYQDEAASLTRDHGRYQPVSRRFHRHERAPPITGRHRPLLPPCPGPSSAPPCSHCAKDVWWVRAA